MSDRDNANGLLYMLAGVGLGAIIGAAAGLLFAPKPGAETREELAEKLKELKDKTGEWVSEQRAKRNATPSELLEEIGA
jgi:gas vesicle protein